MGQGKEGQDSIKAALKWGKLDISVIPYLEEAQIIEVTGWTPEEIDRMDAEDLRAYTAVWNAKGTVTRKESRELKNIG